MENKRESILKGIISLLISQVFIKIIGKCIGGDYFGNYEKVLPVVSGRTYHECDIDTLNAKSRGAKRIIYSDDGQIYYTDNHYKSFTLLYGDDVQ